MILLLALTKLGTWSTRIHSLVRCRTMVGRRGLTRCCPAASRSIRRPSASTGQATHSSSINEQPRVLGYNQPLWFDWGTRYALLQGERSLPGDPTFRRADGTEIYSFPMTYVLRHTDGWKISAAIGTSST